MRVILPIRPAAGAVMCALISTACTQTPAAPSRTAVRPAIAGAMIAEELGLTTEAASLSPGDLATHGWDCRPAPAPFTSVGCSPPNQIHPLALPGPPPPADRPATLTLLVFDSGVLLGTNLLIRSDLYHGQPCKVTGGPYRFISRIGYYECLHVVNGE